MSLIEVVDEYENWLRTRCDVDEKGLKKKHDRMSESAFKFFRATCFRFARQVPEMFVGLSTAPKVPSIGDAHIENWGTWRDGEGRLVWGVNDFDEAAKLPYTYDLLRLATSARLADKLPIDGCKAVGAILDGYRMGLRTPNPCVVDDENEWLQVLLQKLPAAKPGEFRDELKKADRPEKLPFVVERALRDEFAADAKTIEFKAWQKGGGSLGRPRYVAYATWRGGLVVREAKAIVPSAWDWAAGEREKPSLFMPISTGRYRAFDPYLKVWSGFIIRRLAADAQKIDLSKKDAAAFNGRLLAEMGRDLASVHVAGRTEAAAIESDLNGRDENWLHESAKDAEAAIKDDYETWCRHHPKKIERKNEGAGAGA